MERKKRLLRDRRHAGLLLAKKFRQAGMTLDGRTQLLALPRGGVPVAYEMARQFGLPLSLLIVRKLGLPGHEEFAFGAIASGGHTVIDHALCERMSVSAAMVQAVLRREQDELTRREKHYGAHLSAEALQGRRVIVVDDGIATGSTMLAAVQALRSYAVEHITIAVPVLPRDVAHKLTPLIDALICIHQPQPFIAVGHWYQDFRQVGDEEVIELLAQAQRLRGSTASMHSSPSTT